VVPVDDEPVAATLPAFYFPLADKYLRKDYFLKEIHNFKG
jgi:hypothetical protein